MKASIQYWAAIAATLICSHGVSAADLDGLRLQRDFANADDLAVIARWQELPSDSMKLVRFIATRVGPGKSAFANIGEEWSYTDASREDLPPAQHLFSAASDSIAATVFLIGGSETAAYAMVARRSSTDFCLFRLPRPALDSLRISEIQYMLRIERDPTAPPAPACAPQSLDRHIRWPS